MTEGRNMQNMYDFFSVSMRDNTDLLRNKPPHQPRYFLYYIFISLFVCGMHACISDF